jgi:hypothetical protein
MQQSRRANPYPFTWEIPLGIFVAVVLMLVSGVQVGRSLANLFAGGGWSFVSREKLFTTLGGVLSGDAGAGLTAMTHAAQPPALWIWVAVVEVLVLVVCGLAGKAAFDRWGPGRTHGMASKAEAEQLLGRTRLRRAAEVVRPDLHAKAKNR